MTITVKMTNPAEHQPSELRALAHFLNCLADDRESGKIKDAPSVAAIGRHSAPDLRTIEGSHAIAEVAAEQAPLSPTPPAAPVAPSASAPSIPLAPDAPVPPAPATLPGVELDSTGLPWDGRIHSETKNKLQDGSWRKKRGVDAAVVAEVEARLRELAAIPPAAPAVTAPVAPAAPVTEDNPPPAPAMPAAVDTPPVAPVAPAAPAAPEVAAGPTIADVFKFASAAEKAGTLAPDARAAALTELGFNSMLEIGSRPDLAAAIIAKFKEYGA